MTVVLWIVAAAAVIVLLALVLPVRVHVRASGGTDDGFAFTANVRPWGGAVGIGLSSDKSRYHVHALVGGRSIVSVEVTRLAKRAVEIAKAKAKPEPKPEPEKKPKDRRPIIDRIRSGLADVKRYKRIAGKAVAAVLRIVTIERLTAHVTLGLLNPAATGQAAGVLYALNGMLPRHCVIIPSFDFTREVLSGTLAAELRISNRVFWKEVFTHIPMAVAFLRDSRNKSAAVLTQEV